MLWIAFFAAGFVFLAVLYFLDQPDFVPDADGVRPEGYISSFSPTPPPEGWTAFDGDWPPGRQGDEPFTSIWYRYALPTDVTDKVFYIVYAGANIEIWQGAEPLLRSGPPTLPLYELNAGTIVPLAQPITPEQDYLYLRVMREYTYTAVNWTFITTRDVAERDARSHQWVSRIMPLIMLSVMGTFGMLVGLMFWMRRDRTAYGYYALMLLLWGVHTAHEFVADIPFNRYLWACVSYGSLVWLAVEVFFINRYFLTPHRRLERRLVIGSAMALSILVILSIWASSNAAIESIRDPAIVFYNFWFSYIALVCVSRYYVAVSQRADFERVSLFVASGAVFAAGVRDLLFDDFPGLSLPGSTFYLQYAVLIPLSMFGVQLIRRFAHDSRLADLRNEQLRALAEQRGVNLEKTTKRLSEEERRRVLAEERARLMRDMHDGLGGQLVHALALSEQGDDTDLKRSLRAALDDLRLIVDSLSPTEDGLGDLLASYRHRVGKVLRRNDFQITWDLDEEAMDLPLPPNASLSVLRIIQEALTNAVRHSGGKNLHVEVSKRERHIEVAVQDDGVGIPDDVSERGLVNMRVRATEIGGALAVKGDDSGTRVALLLPLVESD